MSKAITGQVNDSFNEVWRRIPPEEKLEMIAKAQSKGVSSSLILLLIVGTLSLGLRLPWAFWSAFIAVPFVFQLASAKAWRDLKPRTMLEYLAARSAVRRYAYSSNSKDLTIILLFKGTLSPDYGENEEQAIEARIANRDKVSVWVGLFRDTVVMVSEKTGGAKLEFSATLGARFSAKAEGFDGSDSEKSVRLVVESRKGFSSAWTLSSPFPAALLVFEKKIHAFEEIARLSLAKEMLAHSPSALESGMSFDDDGPISSFND